MREIKFRGWDGQQMREVAELWWDNHGGLEARFSCDKEYQFTPCLLQFTELRDKNGKEIFEGDICGYDDDPSQFVVVFEACAFRKKYPEWDSRDEKPVISQWDIDNGGMHVLGNIYENTELLTK